MSSEDPERISCEAYFENLQTQSFVSLNSFYIDRSNDIFLRERGGEREREREREREGERERELILPKIRGEATGKAAVLFCPSGTTFQLNL